MKNSDIKQIKQILDTANQVVIIQADNPDSDSLSSALALEQILHVMKKEPILYCGVDIPGYLHYLSGWDRVSKDLPKTFDACIIVDTSNINLLEKLTSSDMRGWVAAKPTIVLDHHQTTDNSIDFAKAVINDANSSSTCEVIYNLAGDLGWELDETSGMFIMSGILGDTQGLTNQLASAQTYRVLAELVDLGVNRPELEEKRRQLSKMPEIIYRYKGKLIERTEFYSKRTIAIVHVPHHEIVSFSPLYNPAPLVQGDMLQTDKVGVSVVLKTYGNGRITAAIRCNNGFPIAGELAEHFGGGGHDYSSGFKILSGANVNDVKSQVVSKATELIDNLPHKEGA